MTNIVDDRRLFSIRTRTRQGFATQSESKFKYLNDSARNLATEARGLWEQLFMEFPGNRDSIWRRFRSQDDHVHASVQLELLTYALLRRMGHGPIVEPAVEQSEKHPDFLITSGESMIHMECTVVGLSKDQKSAKRLQANVIDLVDETRVPGFMVGIDVKTSATSMVNGRQMKAFLSEWLRSLEWNQLAASGLASDRLPRQDWTNAGWTLTFTAVPLREQLLPPRGLAWSPTEGGWSIEDTRLQNGLRLKARKFAALDPLVVVVSSTEYTDRDDVLNALFGTLAVRYIRTAGEGHSGTSRPVRLANGFWNGRNGPKNSHVAGVLFVPQVSAYLRGVAASTFFHHPRATYPLPTGLFPFAEEWRPSDEVNGYHIVKPTRSVKSILGLSEEWPEN